MYWGLNSFEWSGCVRCRLPVSKHRLVILLSGSRCHLSRFVQPLTLPQQTAQRLGNIFCSSWCCVQWMSLTVMMNYINLCFLDFQSASPHQFPGNLTIPGPKPYSRLLVAFLQGLLYFWIWILENVHKADIWPLVSWGIGCVENQAGGCEIAR